MIYIKISLCIYKQCPQRPVYCVSTISMPNIVNVCFTKNIGNLLYI